MKKSKNIRILIFVVAFLVLLYALIKFFSQKVEFETFDSLPAFVIGDCVVYNQQRGVVKKVSDEPTVGTKEYLYDVTFNGNETKQGILESNLNSCNYD